MIECVGGTAAVSEKLSAEILAAVSNAARELRPQGSPKLTYIYTSGCWVHGDSRNEIITDTTPIRLPLELVAWRPAREQQVINDNTLNGFVIRPGIVYGRSGSVFAPFFQSASEGHVWYPGTPGGRFALVHTDDLADLYLRATEKAAICGGLIFDVVNDYTESIDDVLSALVKVSGAKGPYEYRPPTNCVFLPHRFELMLIISALFLVYEVALGASTLLRPYLARALLGWRPSKPGLVDGLAIYYAAWKAVQ